jgi:glycosyltransferase involved in cell wall biosynthesis
VLPTRILNAVTYPLDDAHLAVSHAVAESIPRRLNGDLRVVIHGVFPERIRGHLEHRDEVRAELGVGPDEVLVGTVANYRAQKGYADLLKAARRVLDSDASARFVAIGRGPLEREIRARHRALELGERFILTGYREDAVRVLAACDTFTLASLYEGGPVALMEALALGLPVVATLVGGVPEIMSDGVEGMLVPPARPDLLADAITELVRDPGRRAAMGSAAAERGKELDIRKATRAVERTYREMVHQ